MLIPFFYQLREGGLKTSITELLTLLEAMQKGLARGSVDDFYFLSRACLVKDESQLDRFDRIFDAGFFVRESVSFLESVFSITYKDHPVEAPDFDL